MLIYDTKLSTYCNRIVVDRKILWNYTVIKLNKLNMPDYWERRMNDMKLTVDSVLWSCALSVLCVLMAVLITF